MRHVFLDRRVTLDFRNTNSLWCSVLVETLVRCGLTHAVISPGSRSTPLTIALVRHGAINCVPVLDERSAAFFALGLARRTARPVALVCTSGSAGANYYPAVIEAHESRTPLLVLTADRPPEMRECASGQTIDQQKIFGDHVSWYHELAVPEAQIDRLRYVRQTGRQAWRRALADGPVHLNLPFRDPLPPVTDDSVKPLEAQLDSDFFAWPEEPDVSLGLQLHQRSTTARGLIVAGPAQPADPAAYAAHVLALGRGLGWPVLADALSPVRHYATSADTVISAYDAILRNAAIARDLVPRMVLCLEGWPTSKVLRGWLEQAQAEMLLVSPMPGSRDALHGKTREITAPVTALVARGSAMPVDGYREAWTRAETAARGVLDARLANEEMDAFEGRVSWLLARHLPEGATLCVASSMPVRDVEYVWPVNDRHIRIAFSRGANGIDGTLSTALGVAHDGGPTVLLTGDLALLHDTNGFLTAPRLRGSLTVIVINNNGGGIFEHLQVAQFDPPFEDYFATPQRVDLEQLTRAYGVSYQILNTAADLTAAVSTLPEQGVRVLEWRTDRKRDATLRKRLFAEAAAACG